MLGAIAKVIYRHALIFVLWLRQVVEEVLDWRGNLFILIVVNLHKLLLTGDQNVPIDDITFLELVNENSLLALFEVAYHAHGHKFAVRT